MADDLQTGIRRGSWWMPARSGGYDGQTTSAAAASVACSTTIAYVGDSSNTFQETHNTQPLDYMVGAPMTTNSTLQAPTLGLSPSTMDWSQALMSCGRADTTYHPIIDQDLSSRTFLHEDPTIDSNPTGVEDSLANPFYDMNHSFFLDQNHQSSGNDPKSFQLAPANYDDQSVNYHSSAMDYCGSSSELPQTSWPKFPQASLPPMHQSNNQLHFSNIAHFWNASANTTSDVRSGFHPPTPQSSCNNLTSKPSTQGTRGASSSTVPKKSDPAVKRLRIETPSPLPTFKVRKEKLGDRITALQQLVSPFGKTDTASVLHEAIEYIKFLHDQVSVLTTPYLKNGNPMQHQQYLDKSKDGQGSIQNLRSRGLCLVPIASTYTVASETPVDFWTPTFGGTFR